MGNYNSFLTMVSTEFHRYLMENEKLGEKIPVNAMVIFQVDGEDDFNRWHKETSLRNREQDQPLVLISVKKWRQHSSIEELHLSEVKGKLESTLGAASPA
jgi:hypothetical protein